MCPRKSVTLKSLVKVMVLGPGGKVIVLVEYGLKGVGEGIGNALG